MDTLANHNPADNPRFSTLPIIKEPEELDNHLVRDLLASDEPLIRIAHKHNTSVYHLARTVNSPIYHEVFSAMRGMANIRVDATLTDSRIAAIHALTRLLHTSPNDLAVCRAATTILRYTGLAALTPPPGSPKDDQLTDIAQGAHRREAHNQSKKDAATLDDLLTHIHKRNDQSRATRNSAPDNLAENNPGTLTEPVRLTPDFPLPPSHFACPDSQILTADITTLDIDAIVNAANSSLLGGGGVDGAIHRAAGPQLLDACRALPQSSPRVRCPPGQARITPGFNLPARHIIHTVGPVWSGGRDNEDTILASCYDSCLALAAQHSLRSIAFPAISTGVYGFPPDQAADIAVRSTRTAIAQHPAIQSVIFCCFDGDTAAIYDKLLAAP